MHWWLQFLDTPTQAINPVPCAFEGNRLPHSQSLVRQAKDGCPLPAKSGQQSAVCSSLKQRACIRIRNNQGK